MDAPIICYGEVLWDLLPTGKVAGGAPMNVAFHLKNLGATTLVMSSVGRDRLGRELIEFLYTKGIITDFIQINAQYDTGTAVVQIDAAGRPSYDIVAPVAWDFIPLETDDLDLVGEAPAFIYGSLAARSATSRQTLLRMLDVARYKIFDVNLRAPHYNRSRLEVLLSRADLVKLSREELEVIAEGYGLPTGCMRSTLEALNSKFELQGMVCTLGRRGAVCLYNGVWHQHPAYAVEIVDTVGSGDAFLAAFLYYQLNGRPPAACLRSACAIGALVAMHTGGTPTITTAGLERFIREHSPKDQT